MNISTNVSRLVKLAAVLALASFMASPAAAAGDAWYRDAGPAAADHSSVAVSDDWYRASDPVAGARTAVVAGDDWYREAPGSSPVSLATSVPVDAGPRVTPGGFNWGDFGIGAAATLGALAVLALLALAGRAIRGGSQTFGRA